MLKFELQKYRTQYRPIQGTVPTIARHCDYIKDLRDPHDNATLREAKDS
jgi:hypothetical protein